jgi:hypothetical protein
MGNQTHDPPACSAVPQPTAQLRAPVRHCAKCKFKYHSRNDEYKDTNTPSFLYSYW